MKKKMFVSVLCLSLIVSLCGGVGAAAAESEDERSRAVDVLVASGWSEERLLLRRLIRQHVLQKQLQ